MLEVLQDSVMVGSSLLHVANLKISLWACCEKIAHFKAYSMGLSRSLISISSNEDLRAEHSISRQCLCMTRISLMKSIVFADSFLTALFK
jgi:hypothetical protein